MRTTSWLAMQRRCYEARSLPFDRESPKADNTLIAAKLLPKTRLIAEYEMTVSRPTEGIDEDELTAFANIRELIDFLGQSGKGAEVVGARGAFSALLWSKIQLELRRPLVFVTPDESRAEELRVGLEFFASQSEPWSSVAGFWPLDHSVFSGMSPSRLVVMERMATLVRVQHRLAVDAIVIPAKALIERVIPLQTLHEEVRWIKKGQTLDRDALLRFLAMTGYHPVPVVEDPATFAIRGGILDVFCPLYERPIRIDLWGDEVDHLRFFDPTTQRTHANGEAELIQVLLGPAREVIFSSHSTQRARTCVMDLADELNVPTSRARAMVDNIDAGILAVGMEDLLPAFHEALSNLFELIPKEAIWLVEEPEKVEEQIRSHWEQLRERSESTRREGDLLVFSADARYLSAEEAITALRARTNVRAVDFSVMEDAAPISIRFDMVDNQDVRSEIEEATRDGELHVLSPLTARIRKWRDRGLDVVACAHSEGSVERLEGLLTLAGLRVKRHAGAGRTDFLSMARHRSTEVNLFVGEPGGGFRSDALGMVFLDEADILGRRVRRRRRHAQVAPEAALANWKDLKEGDHIVHLMHGIGRYMGLTKSTVGAIEVDFLSIDYAEGNRLFVPVDKLHLVSRYTPAGSHEPRLDKLGGTRWQGTAKRVRKAVRDIADRLLRLYAEREMLEGDPIAPPDELFTRFEAAFPWDETPDQGDAIEAVLADLQKPRPMDRLVCGDVGFGKTEVALRAACLSILDGKQVALLVPTIILAEQHRITFQQRFSELPIVVEALTRTRTPASGRELRDRIANGQVDLLIGTHRLLSKDVSFRELGLLIIDEEHRFGVAQKERLKQKHPNVHVLTLSATPIPRTLHLSMVGLRDISLIGTPPMGRLAPHTMVAQPTEQVISEAVSRELKRGGQVFYVHNRVEDIDKHAELLSRLVPEARIVVGHGQLDKGMLENRMLKFIRGEANVLVCTTIVESGLDIPNANTMVINRADRFGLAQLYQLRGRIGRSTRRAYCYLLIPAPRNLTGNAAERIAAIQRFSELGSGFSIASHDLDIRGAGDLLGADQAGHIDAVGYDAYMGMLRDAIEEQRDSGDTPPTKLPESELKVAIEARIPQEWLPDPSLRLRLYKRFADARSQDEIFEIFEEAVDRYGAVPQTLRNLVDLMALRLDARRLGLTRVVFNANILALTLSAESAIRPHVLVDFLSQSGQTYRLDKGSTLIREVSPSEWDSGVDGLREALREISNFVNSHSTSKRKRVKT